MHNAVSKKSHELSQIMPMHDIREKLSLGWPRYSCPCMTFERSGPWAGQDIVAHA